NSMPFKSQAQRRKFAQLLVEGKISNQTFEEWNRETGGTRLPEHVDRKKRSRKTARKSTRRKTAKKSAARKTVKKSSRKGTAKKSTATRKRSRRAAGRRK